MKLRALPVLAWSLFGLSVALSAATFWLTILSPPTASGMPAWLGVLLFSILWLAFPAVGAVITARRPKNALGWIFLAIGLSLALRELALGYRSYADPGDLPWGDVAAWVVAWSYPVAVAPIVFLLLLFPDGRPHSPRWRSFSSILGVVGVLHVLALAFTPGPLVFTPEIENPFGAGGIVGRLLAERMRFDVAWQLLWPVAFAGGAASLFFRYRRAGFVQRQQLKWFAIAAAVLAAGLVLVILSFEQETETLGNTSLLIPGLILLTLGVVGVPVASGIAILKHRLFDIDVIIRRSLMYGVLSLLIGGFYVGLAALVGIVVGERFPVGLAVAVTIAATLGFQPARSRLDRLAARLVFGERLSGYELLARFGQTLEHAFDPAELAHKIAETVKDGLDLRWVRVALCFSDGERARTQPIGAAGGALDEQVEAELVVPLAHGDETIGIIECGPKSEGRFLAADHRLLETLGRQAALALHNGRLASELAARLDEIRRQAEELSASRARIVQAQDAERRRIERDIHDGVQQEIVSLAAKLRLARNQLRRDAKLADSTLAELQHETKRTLESIRELAQGIHPAVLTDKGLLEAIEARAGRLPVGVTIEADPQLRGVRFASEVEAAGYFFVSEALANALKHASAARLVVRLLLQDQTLVVEVVDDGVGFVLADVAGSGLTGIRDRIESIGGRLRISSSPGVGTRLLAEVPAHGREQVGV